MISIDQAASEYHRALGSFGPQSEITQAKLAAYREARDAMANYDETCTCDTDQTCHVHE